MDPELKELFSAIKARDFNRVKTVVERNAVIINARCDKTFDDPSWLKNESWRSYNGYKTIHFAAALGTPEIILYLLDKGANPNELSENSKTTALHIASWRGQAENVEVLLQEPHVVLDIRNGWGGTALDEARKFYNLSGKHPVYCTIITKIEGEKLRRKEKAELEAKIKDEQKRVTREQQAKFNELLNSVHSNVLEKLELGNHSLCAASSIYPNISADRALNAEEIHQLLQALKNNTSVVVLILKNAKLNSADCVTLCDIIKNKVLAKIDLSNTQFPETMHDILQEALLSSKSRNLKVIGFELPAREVTVASSSQPTLPTPTLPTFFPTPITASGYQIRYQDLEYGAELGRGSFGIVRRGRWQHMDVAIKELMDPQVLQNFEQEVAVMASLHHSNVIHLCGACLDPGHYSLVMEYMPKGSLYKVLHNSSEPLPWPQRWQIAYDVARGILHLHQHNPEILHRDLKSLNVLLDANYVAKVSDFGLSKAKTETRSTTKMVIGNNSCGTLLWSAPELFGLEPKTSKASDVYAFAIILWEIAARATPYEGVELEKVKSCVKQGERLDLPEGTPPAFAALITRCWAQLPEKRLTIEEVVTEIERNIPQQSGSSSSSQPGVSTMVREILQNQKQQGEFQRENATFQNNLMGALGEGILAQNSVSLPSLPPSPSASGSGSQIAPALNNLGVFSSQSSASTQMVNSSSSSSSTTTSTTSPPKMTQMTQ